MLNLDPVKISKDVLAEKPKWWGEMGHGEAQKKKWFIVLALEAVKWYLLILQY
jgi:hypothetical protein